VIARVRATDADAGANAVLTYSLEEDPNKMFDIAPETGEIRLEKNRLGPKSRSNEVEKETVYHLVVVASDGGALMFYIQQQQLLLLLLLLLILLLLLLPNQSITQLRSDHK